MTEPKRQAPTGPYIQALALGLDPAWRRLPADERRRDAERFAATLDATADVRTFSYSMIGLQAGSDLVIWRLGASLDVLEEAAALALRTGIGRWLTVRESFIGLIKPTQYVAKASSQEQSMFAGERARVVEYCKLDTLETLLVFLAWSVHDGSLAPAELTKTMTGIRALVAAQDYPAWAAVGARLRAWPVVP